MHEPEKTLPSTAEKLSVKEKVGYALGDTAANLIFQTMVMFQLAFYTDTFGITAAAAGTILVVVRVWDAVFDPVMGVLADRTKTRWGKFRPWILWTAVPFGVMGFLAFVTPDFTSGGKLVYAYCTYIVLMMVYSANNLPCSALSGIALTMSVFPAVTFGLCVVCLFFYGIDRDAEIRITGELTERRKGFAVQAS